VLISSFRLHPLADLTRLWEALHGGKVRLSYQDAAHKLGISSRMLQEHLLRSRLMLIAKLKLKG